MKPAKSNSESTVSSLPPYRASEIRASVNLVSPLDDGAEVQEKITNESIADLQRYVELADKLLAKSEAEEMPAPDFGDKAA